jgi:uncharacterized protein (DUF849 family)
VIDADHAPKQMNDVMIMVAPNGARRGKADHPALPVTIPEIAADAAAAAAAGAAAIHLHVRDKDGRHTLDPDIYREAIEAVRAATDSEFIVQITTEAVGRYTREEQMAVVRALTPEAVSLALGEIIPDGAAEAEARAFFGWMAEKAIAPQLILYAPEEVTRLHDLIDRGVLPFARLFLLFVLGRYAVNQQSAPEDLDPFVAALGSRDMPWAMCAFGRREAECALAAARLGGHVRVGFETNLCLPGGGLAASNAALVAATADLLRADGFRPMDATRARRLMGATRSSNEALAEQALSSDRRTPGL